MMFPSLNYNGTGKGNSHRAGQRTSDKVVKWDLFKVLETREKDLKNR